MNTAEYTRGDRVRVPSQQKLRAERFQADCAVLLLTGAWPPSEDIVVTLATNEMVEAANAQDAEALLRLHMQRTGDDTLVREFRQKMADAIDAEFDDQGLPRS